MEKRLTAPFVLVILIGTQQIPSVATLERNRDSGTANQTITGDSFPSEFLIEFLL